MIALLTGRIISQSPNEVIIDVSGVGYHVHTTLNTYDNLPENGETTTLHIHTHVREDTLSLFGFLSRDEKEVFTKLLKVNGIGPKMALSVLSGVPHHDLVEAIKNEDLARLNAIPGVGKKTAERIIIDLKDKLTGAVFANMAGDTKKNVSIYDDAISALVNLGYNKLQAEKVMGKIGISDSSSLPAIIKDALKELAAR